MDRRVVGLHEQAPAPLCGGDHLIGFGRIRGERLFAEHVLAGLESPHGPLAVLAVGQRDVDRVDPVRSQQFLVGVEDLWNVVRGRVLTRARDVATGHSGDTDARVLPCRRDDRVHGHAAGAENTDAQQRFGHHPRTPTAARCPALSASATIVSVPFTAPAVGMALASTTKSPRTSCASPCTPTTDVAGSAPMRAVPTACQSRSKTGGAKTRYPALRRCRAAKR